MKTLLAGLVLAFTAAMATAEDIPAWCHYSLADAPKSAPSFARYRVAVERITRPVHVDLSSKDAHMFRTNLRDAAKESVNFAGHYRIASWGCGTGCLNFAVIDLKTGKVTFDPQMGSLSNDFTDFERDDAVEKDAQRRGTTYEFGVMAFRPDSTLFITPGIPNEDSTRAGIGYWRWTGKRFETLAFYPALKICPRPKD